MPTRTPIDSLEPLLERLRHARTPEAFGRIMAAVRIPLDELLPKTTWHGKHYTRNALARTNEFELMLICFEPGQSTSIHDYDKEQAWILPVSGVLHEERFDGGGMHELTLIHERTLRPGELSHIEAGRSIHRFSNPGASRAMSLNLYVRPLRRWRVYDRRAGGRSDMVPSQP